MEIIFCLVALQLYKLNCFLHVTDKDLVIKGDEVQLSIKERKPYLIPAKTTPLDLETIFNGNIQTHWTSNY